MVNIRRVRTEWTGLPGGPALTTTYFPLGASTQAAIDAMDAFWTTMAPQIANDAAWNVQGDVDEIDPTTGNIVAVTSGTPNSGSGTSASPMLSIGSQGLLNLRTGLYINGRELRGKLYIPVPTTAQNNDGVPTASYQALMVTAYNAALSSASITTLKVYSRTHGLESDIAAVTPSAYFARLRTRQR
jgi:hypothetical protein